MTRVYIIETSDGAMIQAADVPSAISGEGVFTDLVEERVRQAASDFTVPDFVFNPRKVLKGGAPKEVTDALIVAGRLALSVQVKTRDPASASGDPAKEERWIRKHAKKGMGQADGSFRIFRLAGGGRFTNRVGREVDIDAEGLVVCNVVVIDHPDPPKVTLDQSGAKNPTLFLLRYEWEFLLGQLRSVYGVHRYVHGVTALPMVPLGDELIRFDQQVMLAGRSLQRPGNRVDAQSALVDPTLPLIQMGRPLPECEVFWRNLYLSISECNFLPEHERIRLEVMAKLDCLPFSMRNAVAVQVISRLENLTSQLDYLVVQEHSSGIQFVFGLTEVHPSECVPLFNALVHLRHSRHPAVGDEEGKLTIGIMFLKAPRNNIGFTISLVPLVGPPSLTAEQVEEIDALFGEVVPIVSDED
ncbi:hypothetical protein GCM10028790_17690 [Micromonospora taraxaci]|uniref:Uncharacterized protein n=1 Tax=Micromonospora taraxaci TaxID=1316803 RepID=A0A561VY39_9ACTN|nr:hypothetical protein [Micromonospora taraxaci]TWG16531.1 hypothetical protein FHU34_111870 [Micromonospora taraxaci]